MVAPQSRTLVRYRNMIARQLPTPLGCVVVLAHEASPADGGCRRALAMRERCVRCGIIRERAVRAWRRGPFPFSFPLNT